MDVFTTISQRSNVRAYKATEVEENKLKGDGNLISGADRDRTGDLQSAILALSQLSYCPTILNPKPNASNP